VFVDVDAAGSARVVAFLSRFSSRVYFFFFFSTTNPGGALDMRVVLVMAILYRCPFSRHFWHGSIHKSQGYARSKILGTMDPLKSPLHICTI
jgi:hypothetical protein